jgi:soluble lytic murein transglycosylase
LGDNLAKNRGAIRERGKPRAKRRGRALLYALASTLVGLASGPASAALGHKSHPPQLSRVDPHKHAHHKHPAATEPKKVERAPGKRTILASETTANLPFASQLPPDVVTLGQALELVQQHKLGDATKLAASIEDRAAQKLIQWALLRDADNPAGFDQFNNFIQANPDWPSIPLFRRRAEARLWQERRDAATVHRFIGRQAVSAPGRLALARVLLGEGDRAAGAREIRAVWHSAELSVESETAITNAFGTELSAADDLVRMDRRIGAKDFTAATRVAKRLGPAQIAIVKACEAIEANSTKAAALLVAVPSEAQSDLGFVLCRLRWLLAHDDIAAAVKLLGEVSSEDLPRQDTDEWWRQSRMLARRLLDLGDPKAAYRVVSEAAIPANPYYRAEFHFMPGWIALRFLSDPTTALRHFAKIDEGASDPIILARAAYWRGRAFEAAGQLEDMKAQYERAARFPTAYYGQLARGRLGFSEIAVRPQPTEGTTEIRGSDLLRAAEMLYAIGQLDLLLTFVNDFGETSTDVVTLRALGELMAGYHDAQAMLIMGKAALARGLATERYAFPEVGVPSYAPIAPPIDQCMVYAIARVESAFDQRDTSPAQAVGLMQVTPEAGRDTAKRFGVAYDWKRLVSDPVYNTQMGVAEVSALFKEYTRSYVMTFAGYNAGRGRVRQWVAQHGDPRDPKVDAVDWVERIPLAETRNYIQRVMESLQIYAARFGASVATAEPNLHRVTTIESPIKPVFVNAIPH